VRVISPDWRWRTAQTWAGYVHKVSRLAQLGGPPTLLVIEELGATAVLLEQLAGLALVTERLTATALDVEQL
jgi:hypothetical protein